MIDLEERLTIKEILKKTTEHFKEYGISTPRLDAEVLLADLLGMERIELYVQFDRPLEKIEIDNYRKRVIQRSKRMPVAYITGYREFMSLNFKVDQRVLIPRPETEHLVENTIRKIKEATKEELTVVELCTGSGAVIISLAKEFIDSENERQINYVATDISESALEIARENAKKHGVIDQIRFIKGDLLEAIEGLELETDFLIANPPYISKQEMEKIQPEIQYEPDIALAGGEDGFEFYHKIITGARKSLTPGTVIGLELGDRQVATVEKLLRENNFNDIEIIADYAEVARVILGRKNRIMKGSNR